MVGVFTDTYRKKTCFQYDIARANKDLKKKRLQINL